MIGNDSCGATAQASTPLTRRPEARTLGALGYPDIARAADAAPRIALHQPAQREGVDSRLGSFERERRMVAD